MGKRRELRACPSLAGPDGESGCFFFEMQREEKERMFCTLSANMERCMGRYYSAHPEEWSALVKAVSQNAGGD